MYVLGHDLHFPIPDSLGSRVGTRMYFSLTREETPRIYCSLWPSGLIEGRFLCTRVRRGKSIRGPSLAPATRNVRHEQGNRTLHWRLAGRIRREGSKTECS